MPRKFFRKYLPDAEAVRSYRLVALFGRWLQHPNLWRLNRRSVPGAFAIGLFAGLIPGPLQMLAALLIAVPLKKNIAVALATTFYTNPLTIVPLYLIAYQFGALLLGRGGADRRSGDRLVGLVRIDARNARLDARARQAARRRARRARADARRDRLSRGAHRLARVCDRNLARSMQAQKRAVIFH
jgi:hypothetical protein